MSIDRQMDKEDVAYICNTLHTHTHLYISAVKKEWNNTVCSIMDEPRDYYTKLSQKETDKYYMISLVCGI